MDEPDRATPSDPSGPKRPGRQPGRLGRQALHDLRTLLQSLENELEHTLSCEHWGDLLLQAWPKLYADRPLPEMDEATSLEGRVQLMANRHAAGLALHNRRDYKNIMPDEIGTPMMKRRKEVPLFDPNPADDAEANEGEAEPAATVRQKYAGSVEAEMEKAADRAAERSGLLRLRRPPCN